MFEYFRLNSTVINSTRLIFMNVETGFLWNVRRLTIKNVQEKTLDSKFYHDLLKSLMIVVILARFIKLMEKQDN
jgi:hypothetical protein